MKCTKEYRLSFTEKAQALLDQMTLEEKVDLMAGHEHLLASMGGGDYNVKPYVASGCERLGVPYMLFADGPRGCVCGHATCFPVTMARGATFDPELEKRVGTVIGREIRALGGNFFGGVCLNVPYHPGGGRSQEVYGEDPYHIGTMGAALVEGVQSENVIACAKHFAFNSMENARFWVNVTADKRTEREIYTYQFKQVVEAGAAAVMTSYNRYQGKFCGESDYLIRQLLKKEWDFDGFVISDFFMGNYSAKRCINGGQDMEMHVQKNYTVRKIRKALKKRTISMEQIDESVLRIIRTLLAFDEAGRADVYPESCVASPEHIAVAREVAEKSITLLKNDELLPFHRENVSSIALVGDLCAAENIGDHGSSRVKPPYIVTLKKALEDNYPDIDICYVPTAEWKKHLPEIEASDGVILSVGCNYDDEGEFLFTSGGDRKSLSIKKDELEMIDGVTAANERVAVVLYGGNAIRVREWKNKVKAILMAYYPGMEGGNALADILFGVVNPSGKLPFVIAADEAYPKMNWYALKAKYDYYHGYQKIDKEGTSYDYPYGFGMSYTKFQISDARLESVEGETARFRVRVRNEGSRSGEEVVQLYLGAPDSRVDRPKKTLRDFKRVALDPGEQTELMLSVKRKDVCYFGEETGNWIFEDIEYIGFIGTDEIACDANAIRFRFSDA